MDSLQKSGMDSTALRTFTRMIEGGDMSQMMQAFGGALGGGTGSTPSFAGDRFSARPGESAAPTRGAGGPGGGMAAFSDPNVAIGIMQAMAPPGQNAFAMFQSRPQAPTVGPGEYLVSVTQNGKTVRQRLKVERASGTGAASSPF